MKKSKKKKQQSEDVFENTDSPFFAVINDILAAVTLISVLAIVLETVEAFEAYAVWFLVIEYAATAIFTIEYIARIALTKKKFPYIFSFFGIIDLIAILPTYLGLGNFTFLKTARTLRIIRFLRMVRLAKFAHIKRRKDASSSLYGINLQIYAVTIVTAVLILGTLFYIFESGVPEGKDIPSGMYWAFRALLGGIAYPQPETTAGTAVLILVRFCSMILLGLLLSLVGTVMRKVLIGAEKDS